MDRGSAVNFARIPDCAHLMFAPWVLNGIWIIQHHRSLFTLGRYVNEFILIISFFERSSFKLRCEIGTVTVHLIDRLRESFNILTIIIWLCFTSTENYQVHEFDG